MHSNNLIRSILLSLFLVATVNGYSQKDKGFNFPKDFGKTETVVVLGPHAVSSKKVSESIIKAFEKEYSGKIEMLADRYGKNTSDSQGVKVYVLTVLEMPSAVRGTYDYKFGLIESATGTQYLCDFWSGSYKKGAQYYAKHLEQFRKANGGK
ncbi:MAG: hypothetical protein JNK27_15260 [Chitinophagaceae bacterium]|nr:hypothetical protein [Chitinophagaceae bacterium]